MPQPQTVTYPPRVVLAGISLSDVDQAINTVVPKVGFKESRGFSYMLGDKSIEDTRMVGRSYGSSSSSDVYARGQDVTIALSYYDDTKQVEDIGCLDSKQLGPFTPFLQICTSLKITGIAPGVLRAFLTDSYHDILAANPKGGFRTTTINTYLITYRLNVPDSLQDFSIRPTTATLTKSSATSVSPTTCSGICR